MTPAGGAPPAGDPTSGTADPAAALERLRIDRGPGAPRRRRGIGGWILLGVAVALLLLFVWASYGESLTAPEVAVGKSRRITVTEGAIETTASGYVVARRSAAISSRLSGRLESMLVDVGDRVREGQLLGELGHADLDAAVARTKADVEVSRRAAAAAAAQRDATSSAVAAWRARVDESDAAIRETETQLADAVRTHELQQRIEQRGAGTRDTLDAAAARRAMATEQVARARAAAATLRAEVERATADVAAADAQAAAAAARVAVAEAAWAEAEAVRRDASIVAPFAGVVVRKEAEVGEMVSPVNASGSTTRGAIVTLVDFETLEMEVDVIERDVAKVREGADCRIVLDARRGAPYAGVVRQKVPTADRSTSTVRVKVAFRKLDEHVLPEMGGRVEFLLPGRADVALGRDRVLAPARAFTTRDGVSGVFVVREGRVEWTPARAEGNPAAGDVEVAVGLAGGEDVVLEPPADLRSGALVRVALP